MQWQSDLNSFDHASPYNIPTALFSLGDPNQISNVATLVTNGVTSYPNLGIICDYSNVHFYQHNGLSPDTPDPNNIDVKGNGVNLPNIVNDYYTNNVKNLTNNVVNPFVITEVGFNDDTGTGPNDAAANSYYGDPAVNGVYTLDVVLDAYVAKSKLTDLYELFDEAPSGTGNFENYWGLFDSSGNPKPSALNLHNMLTVLGDAGATVATFKPGTLNYTITGLDAAPKGNTLLLEKSDGTFELVVWENLDAVTSNGTLTLSGVIGPTVTIDLGATFRAVNEYDPVTNVMTPLANARSITLNLSADPIIIEVKPPHRVADFTGAGTSDILFRDVTSGSTADSTSGWLGDFVMNNGTATGPIAQIGWADLTLNIVGVGDFDGDGTSNILFRSPGGTIEYSASST